VHKDGELVRVTNDMQSRLEHIAKDASLHYVLPRHSLTPLLRTTTMSAQQVRGPGKISKTRSRWPDPLRPFLPRRSAI
jgi:hypothetical protein